MDESKSTLKELVATYGIYIILLLFFLGATAINSFAPKPPMQVDSCVPPLGFAAQNQCALRFVADSPGKYFCGGSDFEVYTDCRGTVLSSKDNRFKMPEMPEMPEPVTVTLKLGLFEMTALVGFFLFVIVRVFSPRMYLF